MKGNIIGFIANMPIIGRLLVKAKRILIPNLVFKNSSQYWEERYLLGGTSGSGSYGRLARFKANVINNFVDQHNIKSIVEWGCGDGAQLSLAEYPNYVGYDVSPMAVKICKEKFKDESQYRFFVIDEYCEDERFDLALSLDVIYHLVEDEVFCKYMRMLFDSATRFVIIYASNINKFFESKHERGREFLDWVESNAHQWNLIGRIRNPYPYDPQDPSNTSQSDFYIFGRR